MKKTIQAVLVLLLFAAAATAQDMPQGRRGIHRQDWTSRRADGGQDRGPGGDYYTGERHQLTILAEFADQAFAGDETATLAQWEQILNGVQFNDPPFLGSFHDYFYDQSYGQFNLVCDLQYVKVGNRVRYRSTDDDDENSQFLVQDIVDSLLLRDIEWSRYDWNGDGYVNQLLIIFAGKGSSYGGFGGGYDAIWPHQWWLSEHLIDRQPGAYCQPRTAAYQGNTYIIDSYCAVQELHQNDTYAAFGTLCHEFSHCFGLPDFYSNTISGTPFQWDLMDYGNYNGGGFCPAGYSAHERWLMGWMTPVELTQTTYVRDMPALADEPVAYLIRNDGYESEYYIVENRKQEGWDAYLPGAGLLVFHIDFVPQLWYTTDVNTSNEQHYMLMKANNKSSKYSCAGWAFPYDTVNCLTDTSVPQATLWHNNTDGTKLMSKPLTNMSVTNGLASFDFMASTTALDQSPICPDTQSPDAQSPYSQHPATKYMKDGRLLIFRAGNTYTLTGQVIK